MTSAGMDLVGQLLSADEGLRLKVYDDATGEPIGPGSVVKGHPTIGYGLALDTDGITQDEAEFLRQRRVTVIVSQLSEDYTWFDGLTANRQAVIVCMVYQLGRAGFAEFHSMSADLANADYVRASQEMLLSKWATQVPARSQKLSQMMVDG